MGIKIYTNEYGHMTKVAAMPIYGKCLKKSSSPELIDRWPSNLVCSIRYQSTNQEYTNDVLGLTLTFYMVRSNMVKCNP